MTKPFFRLLIALVAALAGFPATGQAPRTDQIVITRGESGYTLAVPVSRIQLFIPDVQMSPRKPDGASASPRYFYFSDPARGLVVSGWFEPAERFRDLNSFWAEEQAGSRKAGLPERQDVELKEVGKWQAIFYDIAMPSVSNLHVRAELVQAGTWIDLHVSLTGSAPNAPLRSTMESFIRSIVVTEKNGV